MQDNELRRRYRTTGGMENIGNAQQIRKWSRCKGRLARPPHLLILILKMTVSKHIYILTAKNYKHDGEANL
jgi:hypothetical protein